VPRRTRRRIVGNWEQIEREQREEELRELERELRVKHGRGGRHRRRSRHAGPAKVQHCQPEPPDNESLDT
jgi:hypothetical protein